ncbi:MAG: ATP-binding protein [Desulfobacteraceae bacterium]|jgi:two-component system sensor histidine kinase HydH
MVQYKQKNLKAGLQTSPWIILGSTLILLVVVIVLAVQNTHREKRSMTKILRAKGTALIRAVEAGARTGMMGMRWGGQQIQRLLEETGQLPDVKYMAVVDDKGTIVAHSDSSKVNTPFRSDGQSVVHLGPDLQENWELVNLGDSGRVFEVHRHFRPLFSGPGRRGSHRQGMIRWHGKQPATQDDWFIPQKRQQLLIVAGLDVTFFEQAIKEDIRNTIVMSVTLLLLGFGGFVSLFWMNSYRAAKRTLQDTSAFADEVVAHLPVGLIATDREGKITFFNDTAERITGLRAAEAANKAPEALLPAQLCGLKKVIQNSGAITEKEMECTFSSGRVVPLSVSATRIINAVGEFVGHILILRDLGQIHRLQDEIRRQEKLAAIGGLAAGVAHEIRNPLSSIKGLATFFGEQAEDGSEAKKAAGVMVNEVDRLNRVITELLDFSKPTDLKRKPTDLAPLVTRSLQLIQQDTINRDITVNVDIDENIYPVHLDPDRLTQCLLNLYLNAIQAMPNGGTMSLNCTVDAQQSHLLIRIEDTGCGIGADDLTKIFNPYYTTKGKGTGLGLAIVHKIVDAHHGRIKVESEPGKGSTFILQIPYHTEKPQEEQL